MWYRILPRVMDMSLTASVVILFVLLARLALKKAPRIFSYALWAIVLFRLLCPVTLSSPISLLNALPDRWQSGAITSVIASYTMKEADLPLQSTPEQILDPELWERPDSPSFPLDDPSIYQVPSDQTSVLDPFASYITGTSNDTPLLQIDPDTGMFLQIATLLWLAGILGLLIYSLHSLGKLRRQLIGATPLRGTAWTASLASHQDKTFILSSIDGKASLNKASLGNASLAEVYLADHITTPFVLGLVRPRIYLPSSLPEENRSYILTHEQHHIRRLDHVWKLLAFGALCIHWFNPFVWLAFVLSGKDMEMSCDEAVLHRMGDGIRADYSSSLLTLATGQRIFASTPLAFGEGDTKDRIHHMLHWKRPHTWIIVAAIVACLILAVSLSTDPSRQTDFFGARYTVKEILYDAPQYSFSYTVDTAPEFTITSDHVLLMRGHVPMESNQTDTDSQWKNINGLYKVDYSRQELYALFDPLYCNAHEKLDQVKVIYRAEPFNVSASVFYLVMQTKKGDVLLAQGYGKEGDDTMHVRWLFQLEQVSGNYDLDQMQKALQEKYGKGTEYFSLHQLDTDPDTILLGFQVGSGASKGPSAVGYSCFRYDSTNNEYLLAHSEVLAYQVTGLYPVKLLTLDNKEINLQIVLSTRDDLSAVKISSPLKGMEHFQVTQEVIGGPSSPSMLVFQCPDELTLKTLNLQYLYDASHLQTANSIAMKPGNYYLVDTGDDSSDTGDPSSTGNSSDSSIFSAYACLTLQEDNLFAFTYDPLSSYLSHGHYTIQDDLLVAVTDDGRLQYCFQIVDENTLRFVQGRSSEVRLIDERFGKEVNDGTLFRSVWFQ